MDEVYINTLETMIKDFPFKDTERGQATVQAWQIALDIFKRYKGIEDKEESVA